MNASSFYVTGGTLSASAPCYVERKADAELLAGITGGSYVFVLDSRQIGKSSLCIRTLAKLREQGIRTAFVDLTKFGVRNITAEQWYLAILREVSRSLGLGSLLLNYWNENEGLAPVQRFFGSIHEVVLSEISDPVAIFVDEIDVTRSLPFDTDEFFAGIRQCYIGRANDPALSRVTFSLFGTASPAELIQDTRVSPFNIGRRIELEDFTLTEASVLAQYLPGDSQSVLGRIVHWTNGHPYLTQRLCQFAAEGRGNSDVDAACAALFLENRARESDDNLAFVRNRLLKNDVDLTSLLELYEQVRSGKEVRDEEASPLCSILRMSGVVRSANGILKVRNRIYARVFDRAWVYQQLPDAEHRRQRAAFRRGLFRAAAIAACAIGIVSALALYAFSQAGVAKKALASAQSLTRVLEQSQSKLRTTIAQMNDALALAEKRRLSAEQAQAEAARSAMSAKSSSDRAARQERLAQASAIEALRQSANARSSSALASSRHNETLISTAMERLDASDSAGAIQPLLEAIREERGDARRVQIDRLRLAYAVHSASNLSQVWSGSGPMVDALFLHDRKSVMTVNASGEVRRWMADSGKPIGPVLTSPLLLCEQISENGRYLVTGGRDGVVRLWDLAKSRLERSWQTENSIGAVGVSAHGEKVAAAFRRSRTTVVTVWRGSDGKTLGSPFSGSEAATHLLAFTPDANRLIVGSSGFIAYSVDLGDGLGTRSIPGCYSAYAATMIAGGKFYLINGQGRDGWKEGLAQLCDRGGTPIVKYLAPAVRDGEGRAFSLSSDKNSILAATTSGTLQLFDLRTGARKGATIRSGVGIRSCDLSPDGDLATAACLDGSVRTWSLSTGEPIGSILWHGAPVTRVHFDSTGRRLLTCSEDGTARLWEIRDRGLDEHSTAAGSIPTYPRYAWIPGGDLFISSSNENFQWNRASGWSKILVGYRNLGIGNSYLEGMAPSGSGASGRFILAGKMGLRVYDAFAHNFVSPLIPGTSGSEAFPELAALSPDGAYLALRNQNHRFQLYALGRKFRLMHVLLLPEPIAGNVDLLAFLPSSDCMITSDPGGRIDFWSITTGAHRLAFVGKANQGVHYMLSPDGSRMGLVLRDPGPDLRLRGRIYQTSTGRLIASSENVGSGYEQITFNADGTRFLIVSSGGVNLWDGEFRFLKEELPYDGGLPLASPTKSTFFDPMSRCLRDFSTGALLTPPIVKHGPAFAAFSSDGKYVAAANNVEFGCYSFATHKLIGGSLGSRSFLYFLPGTDLLLSNTEGKLRVWDPDTAEEILPSMGDTGATRLICGPQGTELVLSKPVGFTEIELPFIEGSAANLGHEAALVSKTTLQSLDAAKWARLKKRPISPSPELSPFLERIDEKPLSNDFTLSSAIRDANMHWPDKGNRMALAEAAAKVEDWAEAERTLDALASEGVDGLGFDFLAASVALAQKKYVRAEEGYRKALTFDKATDVSEKRKIYQLLCQSLIGTGEFKEASDEFKSEPTANDYQASIALALSISAKAAGGQIDEAVGELRRRSEEREKLGAMFDDTAEYFAPIAASLGVSPELLETYVRSLDGEDLSAVAVSTQAIYFAEIGQFRKARQLLQSAIAPADEPLYLLAQALSSEPSQRNQLMKSCLEACHRLIQENNCTTPETTQKLIRAKIISLVENSHRGFTVLKAATK